MDAFHVLYAWCLQSWENLDWVDMGGDLRWGFGLNLGDWTPFPLLACHPGKIIPSFILL